MIELTESSVFNTPAEVVANTVNCEGAMGAGLALEFALRHPELETDYQQRCQEGSVQIGRPYLFNVTGVPYRAVLNFPTKKLWRFPSQLSWIDQGVSYISQHYNRAIPAIRSLALPRLGCDKGSLDWEEVCPLIKKHLADLPELTVYLCADTAAPAGIEAEMLAAFARDQQASELPPILKGRARNALLSAKVPPRFRLLAGISGVGKQSYAQLFQHYYQRRDQTQLSLLSIATAQA